MRLPCYIIHLERATARRPQAEVLCKTLGPEVQIVPAVDGTRLTPAALDAAVGPSRAPRYPFALRPAEIATFLSHRACWQRLLDEGHYAALIVEDDIVLGFGFQAACHLALSHLPENGFVRLPRKCREAGPVIAEQGGISLFRPQLVGLGMHAQIVTAGAASQLLLATERFDRPVDTFLQLRWLHRADMLSVWHSAVSEVSAGIGGSTIHERMGLGARLRREVLRPLYRMSVRFHSYLHRNDT